MQALIIYFYNAFMCKFVSDDRVIEYLSEDSTQQKLRHKRHIKFGIETLGPWSPSAHSRFKEIPKHLVDASRDTKAGFHLGQRLSVAIQRDNATRLFG